MKKILTKLYNFTHMYSTLSNIPFFIFYPQEEHVAHIAK